MSLVDEPWALTFKSKAVKMACDPSGAGRRNGLVASCLNVDAPGVTPTRGAQMYTGGQKISAGVWDCPKDRFRTAQTYHCGILQQQNHQVIQAWQLLRRLERAATFGLKVVLEIKS